MPISDPTEFGRVYVESFNSGSLDALLALYEPGIAMLPQPGSGEAVTGTDAVRQVLSGFLATKGRMDGDVRKVVRSGELALVCTDWSLTGNGQDGNPVDVRGQATDVLRQQADGTWRIVIDNPFGVA
jgi:ketosteroid isomerase-like protein